jgi:glutamyl-tRNA synthetase
MWSIIYKHNSLRRLQQQQPFIHPHLRIQFLHSCSTLSHQLQNHHYNNVRVRYAPSPTGSLHLGGLRTALFNYLFAKANNGSFILRIEDTDKTRQKKGAIAGLVSSLKWSGLEFDEGPERIISPNLEHGNSETNDEANYFKSLGSYGPYIQSQRLPIYKLHAEKLLESGAAYRCFCSPTRLANLREAQARAGVAHPIYDRACTRISQDVSASRAASGESHVIRMRVPTNGSSTVNDIILGDVTFSHAGVDDQILIKSDGYPTYHLASVVDDHLMKISHVIRGQEWLSSTPKHLILYSSFGWTPPSFAHLPLLLNIDRSKLSKRHGDASVEDFVKSGYLPQALVNFVAFLGWSPTLTQNKNISVAPEVLDISTMIELFNIHKLNKANAVVDIARLDFINGQHIRQMMILDEAGEATKSIHRSKTENIPLDIKGGKAFKQIHDTIIPLLQKRLNELCNTPVTFTIPEGKLNALLVAQHERVHIFSDFVDLLVPFAVNCDTTVAGEVSSFAKWINRKEDANLQAVKKVLSARWGTNINSQLTSSESNDLLPKMREFINMNHLILSALNTLVIEWSKMTNAEFEDATNAVSVAKKCASVSSIPSGSFLMLIRYLTTGSDVGASLTDSLRLLGAKASIARIKMWIN